jgi:soluble lytic murein transglycosylase
MALFAPVFLATAASGTVQSVGVPYTAQRVPIAAPVQANDSVGYAIADWRRLRQSDGYPFATYARFLASNPDWPGESAMRRAAERRMQIGESPALVVQFFASDEPQTGNGWARLAEAHLATGRPAEALAAARGALKATDLSSTDEAMLFGRFGPQFNAADYDRRIDALLFARKPSEAQRLLNWSSPARRPALNARLAMITRSPDAERYFAAAAGNFVE